VTRLNARALVAWPSTLLPPNTSIDDSVCDDAREPIAVGIGMNGDHLSAAGSYTCAAT
jgi:hypothetical protein